MKRLLTLVAIFATVHASAQQVNPVPDYVFRNQMSVGRGTVTDTAAYFSIGPRYGANKGFMPPIVGDTATFSSGKRNGLLIFSVQKNKFLYWDSVRVQWSDMAGSSGSYITGSGITGYLPQFSASTTIDTSALFTIGNRLGIGSSTFAYTSTNTANLELNGTAGGILGFKRNDSARGYLWHTGDNMELANTVAGSISFNTNSATRGSISSAGVWRLHNLAGTGDRVVVASSNGTLSASTSMTGLVDTLTISTRAWRQKGIDSVVSIIPAAGVGGSGTTNRIAKFTASGTLGNGSIADSSSSVAMTILSSGNIGIGTTAPGSILDVRSSGYNIIRSTGGNGGYFDAYNTSGTRLASFGAESGGDVYFGSRGSSPVIAITNSTERLRITSGGDVGIGTDAPNARITVQAGASVASAMTFRANNVTSTSELFVGQSIGNDAFFYNRANAIISLGTNNAERMRIHANGRVGINTTTDAGYQFDINGTLRSVNGANFATTSGNVGIGTTGPGYKLDVLNSTATDANILRIGMAGVSNGFTINRVASSFVYSMIDGNVGIGTASPLAVTNYTGLTLSGTNGSFTSLYTGASQIARIEVNTTSDFTVKSIANVPLILGTNNTENARINTGGELLINTTTDAGDYKLQVSGNALVTAGKLDITTNTAFGLSVSRSGTSVVGGQINNSNGILYYGAESSTGGGLFTGSSAYAAVIGSGAAYPLQFATDNVTRATINTNGELLIATTTDNGDFKLQVNGSALISGSIQTANPVSGTAVPWRLGSVVATSVQLDTGNYVEVNINGTFYRLAIVTPL